MMNLSIKVIYRSFYDLYQEIGRYFIFSIVWFIFLLPLVTIGPATAALFYVLRLSRTKQEVTLKDYWQGMKKYWVSGNKISAIYWFVTIPALFYLVQLNVANHTLSFMMAILLVCLLFLWQMIHLFIYGLLVEQEEAKVEQLYLRAYRIVVENGIFCLALILNVTLFTFLFAVFPILLFIWPSWMALTMYNSTVYLLSQYAPESYTFSLEVSWRGLWSPWKN